MPSVWPQANTVSPLVRAVVPLADLEQRLADARAGAVGTASELAAIVELASRLVRDPRRRGELAREGVELARRLGDEVAELRCRAMVAEAVTRAEGPTVALPDALQVLTAAERCGDPQAAAQARHVVAICFHDLDCWPEALEHARRAVNAYQRAGDLFGEGRILSTVGAIAARLGEDVQAVELYRRAHDIFLECDDPSGAGLMLANAAHYQVVKGDHRGAVETCQRAFELFEQAGNPLDGYWAMLKYAEALVGLGQPDAAALWIERAAQRNLLPDGRTASPEYAVDILLTAAEALQIPRGELDMARATLERAVRIADEQGTISSTAKAEFLLAGVLRASGDLGSAYDHLERSRQLTEELARSSHDRRVRALRVQFEVEQAQRDAMRYRDQTLAQAEVIAELERTKAELQRLNVEVSQLSQTDPLTGIANRRFMSDRLTELVATTRRYSIPLAVAIFDVDRFKQINDRYGHAVGDAVLVTIAELTRCYIRASDLPARLGGDEFVIIMPGVRGAGAVLACRRLHAAVRGYPWEEVAPDLTVTISVGISDATGQTDPDEVLRLADAALYRSKHAGRDTVML
jgi:diguanylate cyclase (GGDEF)-like protein